MEDLEELLMKLDFTKDKTTITLGDLGYAYNQDKLMDAVIYLSAKSYWEWQGEHQYRVYADTQSSYYSKNVHRDYLRIKLALKRFEGLSEEQIFDGLAYGRGLDPKACIRRVEHKYHKTIETLFNLRGYMWS